MKAAQFSEYGDASVLKLVDVEEPHAGPGQVRIAVRAAGVNPIDWKIRAGHMREMMPLELPAGSGNDAAGVVDEVGDGVEGVTIGDAVFGTGSSTYAEHAVLDAWASKPEGLSFEEAAGYPIPVETAIRILDLVGVGDGGTVLVSGAAGGVGSAAVQIARERGATVIGTASEHNQDYLRGLGAIPTTYGDGLIGRVRALAPDGVDAALDIAGSGIIPELIELTGDPTRVVSIADFSADEYGAQFSSSAGDGPAAFAEAARLFEAGKFTLRVTNLYGRHEADAAHAESERGHVAGRTIIKLT